MSRKKSRPGETEKVIAYLKRPENMKEIDSMVLAGKHTPEIARELRVTQTAFSEAFTQVYGRFLDYVTDVKARACVQEARANGVYGATVVSASVKNMRPNSRIDHNNDYGSTSRGLRRVRRKPLS